jgi:hypothetical protein
VDSRPLSLLRVGYWRQVGHPKLRGENDEALPDPRFQVNYAWNTNLKAKVVSYLRQGWIRAHYRGYSYCRFYCGISNTQMGTCDLSDGVWVWPEGLPHYVEEHSVRLPLDFLVHLKQCEFEMPKQAPHGCLPRQEDAEAASSDLSRLLESWTFKQDI